MKRPPGPDGLRPPSPDELVPLVHHGLQAIHGALDHVDVRALSAWIAAGVELFPTGALPTMRSLLDGARRVLLTQAAQRHGKNITQMAAALGTSRRSVRDQLRRTGLYDETWPRLEHAPEQPGDHGELADGAPPDHHGDDDELHRPHPEDDDAE